MSDSVLHIIYRSVKARLLSSVHSGSQSEALVRQKNHNRVVLPTLPYDFMIGTSPAAPVL